MRFEPLFRSYCITIPVLGILLTSRVAFADWMETLTLTEPTIDYIPGGQSEIKFRPDAAFPDFSYDFSSLGDELFHVKWEAPPGKCFLISVPADYSAQVRVWFTVGSQGDGNGEYDAAFPFVHFEGLSGNVLPFGQPDVYFSGTPNPGAFDYYFNIRYDFNLEAGDTVLFKSVSVSDIVPASYNGIFQNGTVYEYGLSGSGFTSTFPTPPDPGGWIRLVRDPKTVAQIAALNAKIKGLKKSLRRAKKSGDQRKVSAINREIGKLKKKIRFL